MSPSGKMVWVVDDEPDVLVYLAAAFEDEDLLVRSFPSGEGLLDEARRAPPDLVCLDIMMPNRSGLSLYRDIRRDASLKKIPVVIVSGYSREAEFLGEEFRRLVGEGGIPAPDGFVEKPVSLPDLLDLVGRLLVEGR